MSYPLRFYSLWSINGPLDSGRLRGQLDAFVRAGLDGVVFHPRYYPNDPVYLGDEYLSVVSDVVLHAKSLGLRFWIYDENGWPSGTVGGQLLARYPTDAQHWLALTRQRPERCIRTFRRGEDSWYLADCVGQGVDYLSRATATHFLAMTHERYREGLLPEAFDHVEAFFCDEPEFGLGHVYERLPAAGAVPWTPMLPERFTERYGRDLLPLLPSLFFPGQGHQQLRIEFWELLSDLFVREFIAPIEAWCARYGKKFAAHVKGEEQPIFQLPTTGSAQRVFNSLSIPGIDALGRDLGNDFYSRQCVSAATQFGDSRAMVEIFGAPDGVRRRMICRPNCSGPLDTGSPTSCCTCPSSGSTAPQSAIGRRPSPCTSRGRRPTRRCWSAFGTARPRGRQPWTRW